jgi:enediyne biosynthesis protein E4
MTDAIGSRVTVKTGSLVQMQDMIPVTGYLSQSDSRCHFGVGPIDKIDRVEIRWPDRTVTVQENVKPDQFLKVEKPKS